MLIVEARNAECEGAVLGDHRTGTARYDVRVRVNLDVIWSGRVGPHRRSDGAEGLLRRIADAMAAARGPRGRRRAR